MKKFLMGTVALAALGLATSANAADMGAKAPVYAKAPAMAVSVYNWTGFYVGVNGGYGWSDIDWTFGNGATADHRGNGWLLGGHAGYNWQSGQFVLGVEGDIDWANIKGSTLCPNATFTCGHEARWLASLRGRLGMTFMNNAALLYATGGVAWGNIRYDEFVTATGLSPAGQPNASKTHVGWVAGLGMEYMIAPAWTARFEYLHYGFSSHTFAPADLDGVTTVNVRPNIDVVRAGIADKFGGPVVAKY